MEAVYSSQHSQWLPGVLTSAFWALALSLPKQNHRASRIEWICEWVYDFWELVIENIVAVILISQDTEN